MNQATDSDWRANVARALEPGGWWLSLIGSTEGLPRDVRPPRRSARHVTVAIEPALEIGRAAINPVGPSAGTVPATGSVRTCFVTRTGCIDYDAIEGVVTFITR